MIYEHLSFTKLKYVFNKNTLGLQTKLILSTDLHLSMYEPTQAWYENWQKTARKIILYSGISCRHLWYHVHIRNYTYQVNALWYHPQSL